MAHTRAWDESKPAGSDAAASLDNTLRDFWRDIRERMALTHVWSVGTTDDGKHKLLSLKPADNTTPINSDTTSSVTGSATNGLMDLLMTWNTTGVATLLKATLTNTASGAGSLLMSLIVGAASVFSIDLLGIVTAAGGFVNAGVLRRTAVISPATMSTDVNDWAPTGLSTCSVIRAAQSVGIHYIRGMVAQPAGTAITICNIGAQDIYIAAEDAGSVAANRFKTAINFAPGYALTVWYDGTDSRWRILST